jgi:hypothetical protein
MVHSARSIGSKGSAGSNGFAESADSRKGPSSLTASALSKNASNQKGRLGKSSPSKPMSRNRGFNVSKADHGLAQLSESKGGISGAHSYLSNHSELTGPFNQKNPNSKESSPISQSNREFRNQPLTASSQKNKARAAMKERDRT